MKATILSAIIIAASLTAANFTYQILQAAPDFTSALERSWFQAFAILTAWVCWK